MLKHANEDGSSHDDDTPTDQVRQLERESDGSLTEIRSSGTETLKTHVKLKKEHKKAKEEMDEQLKQWQFPGRDERSRKCYANEIRKMQTVGNTSNIRKMGKDLLDQIEKFEEKEKRLDNINRELSESEYKLSNNIDDRVPLPIHNHNINDHNKSRENE